MTYSGPVNRSAPHRLLQPVQHVVRVRKYGVETRRPAGRAEAPVVGDKKVCADFIVVRRDLIVTGDVLPATVEKQHRGVVPPNREESARQDDPVSDGNPVVHRPRGVSVQPRKGWKERADASGLSSTE